MRVEHVIERTRYGYRPKPPPSPGARQSQYEAMRDTDSYYHHGRHQAGLLIQATIKRHGWDKAPTVLRTMRGDPSSLCAASPALPPAPNDIPLSFDGGAAQPHTSSEPQS